MPSLNTFIYTLFPQLEEQLDPLTEKQQQLVTTLELVRIEQFLPVLNHLWYKFLISRRDERSSLSEASSFFSMCRILVMTVEWSRPKIWPIL